MPAFVPGRLNALISRFRGNTRGNIAVIFAIASVPIVTAVGMAVDVATAYQVQKKIQTSVAVATVSAVAKASPGYAQNVSLEAACNSHNVSCTSDLSVAVADMLNVFQANIQGLSPTIRSTVQPAYQECNKVAAGLYMECLMYWSATVPTAFLGLIGYPSLTFGGFALSSTSAPIYTNYYVMVDVSGSMGAPSTPSEVARLQAINPDNYAAYNNSGCGFACHFTPQSSGCADGNQQYSTNSYCLGYTISRISQTGYQNLLSANSGHLPSSMISPASAVTPTLLTNTLTPVTNSAPYYCQTAGTNNCIQLQIDAVSYGIEQMISTANTIITNVHGNAGWLQIGIYPFINKLYSTYQPLTANLNCSITNPAAGTICYKVANLGGLLDTNTTANNTNLGSGGTRIDTALANMSSRITFSGQPTGDQSAPLQYVVLITDGTQDTQVANANGGTWTGCSSPNTGCNNSVNVIDPTTSCTPLKNRGITIAVVYVPYQTINPAVASFNTNEIGAANSNIANISASLQACASSPALFYTATSPAQIASTLQTIANQSTQGAVVIEDIGY
jgi:Flp pilus assembly protein TadG